MDRMGELYLSKQACAKSIDCAIGAIDILTILLIFFPGVRGICPPPLWFLISVVIYLHWEKRLVGNRMRYRARSFSETVLVVLDDHLGGRFDRHFIQIKPPK
jgi:hypothetical protein